MTGIKCLRSTPYIAQRYRYRDVRPQLVRSESVIWDFNSRIAAAHHITTVRIIQIMVTC
jgi:hypothetical protein